MEPRIIRTWADMIQRLLSNKPGIKRKLELVESSADQKDHKVSINLDRHSPTSDFTHRLAVLSS